MARANYSPDPEALLDAANIASEKVSALHIAFLALCTYVGVIVFSTTDLDLLIGKGIKLPVVDVEVPIVGFYSTVPFLVVLVHFHLLLQLQLLSRKLYAFDEATPPQEGIDGLRDQLNIFPFNYYLVGRPSQLVAFFIALLVVITMLLLPVAALLTLQARFLAYQNATVTWAQRIATWLDIGLVVVLWPVIIDRQDSWGAFMIRVWQSATQRWLRWGPGIAGFAIAVWLLANEAEKFEYWLFIALAAALLLTLFEPALPGALGRVTGARHFGDLQTKPKVVGLTGLLATILFGLPLPLMLQVEGEAIDRPKSLAALTLDRLRYLDVHEKVLLGKSALSETIADLRSADRARTEAAERSIERVDLQDRNLRRADLRGVLTPLADLRRTHLQRADLTAAQLQGANLQEAQLQGADLGQAQLQGANFNYAELQAADLTAAQLQGASLEEAQLQGAILAEAQLQGANLEGAELQGASLEEAQLQGANLEGAQLQGASLERAQLQGANLEGVELQGANLTGAALYTQFIPARAELVDVRGLKWQPLSAKDLQDLQKMQLGWRWSSKDARDHFLKAIHEATSVDLVPPMMGSCLRDVQTQTTCENDYDFQKFRELLFVALEKLICGSPYIVHGVLARLENEPPSEEDSATAGLALRLQDLRKKAISKKSSCSGLLSLIEEDKARLIELGDKEVRASRISPPTVDSPKRRRAEKSEK